jgi:predicted nucleic acid-binding protein
MNLYCDSSALAKLYLQEGFTDETETLVTNAALVATSVVALPEVAAAIERAAKSGRIAASTVAQMHAGLNEDWSSLLRLPVTDVAARRAAALIASAPLHGFDAVHLASALMWAEALAEPVTFATFDRPLWHAAEAEGLHAWPANFGR